MNFKTNWEYRNNLTAKGRPFIEINRVNADVQFHHIPERDYHDKLANSIGVAAATASGEYTDVENKIKKDTLIESSSKGIIAESHTPFLYSSFSDFRQPKGYQSSDLKVSYLSSHYSEARQVAPVIKLGSSKK